MIEHTPDPEKDVARVSGTGNTPSSPASVPPSPPATTTDLGRFPESSESSEVTSLIGSERSKRGSLPQADTPAPANREFDFNFDPQIKIERKIGAGGMGEVFLGYQKHLDRKVAVKRIRAWDGSAEDRERFIQEAKAQSRLGKHPGIAQVYDFREVGDSFYLVMEYVPGRTLEEVLAADGKFTPEQLVRVGSQLSEALEFAAHEGYIHRDLKPGNVILNEDGKVKIIDFGLALRIRSLMQTRVTQKGEILGTPSYMSPEQLNQEEKLDVRSDIWSLGILLYALGTGGPPFTGKDFACTLRNVMLAEPAPLPTIEPGFPEALWQVIAKALKKVRAERWQDYASLRDALQASLEAPASLPTSAKGAELRCKRPRTGALFTWLAAGGALIFAGALAWHHLRSPAEDSASSPRPGGHPEAVQVSAGHDLPKKEKDPDKAKIETYASASKKGLTTSPEKNDPPAPRLREKLFKWTPTERAQSALARIIRSFEDHRSELAAYSFDGVVRDGEMLEGVPPAAGSGDSSPEEREYIAAHAEQAKSLAKLARSTVAQRLGELSPGSEVISLRLRKASPISGRVVEARSDSISVKDDKGNTSAIPLSAIAPEEFLSNAPEPAAQAALLALTSDPALALRKVLALSDASDELLLWIPVILRLASLDVIASAGEISKEAAPSLISRQPLEERDGLLPKLARLDQAVKILSDEKSRVLGFYPFLAADVEVAGREKEALVLLLNGAFSKVLAGFPNTGAYPTASQVLLHRFTDELASSSQEFLADGAWYDFQWKIFPPVRDLPKPEDYFLPGYQERPLLFRDPSGLRKLVMGKVGLRVEEGVLLTLAWKPYGNDLGRSHWEFLLRGRERSENFLRVDDRSLALCRSVLTPGAKDIVLLSAALPLAPVEKKYKTFIFLPGEEHLHVFVDGEIVLSIPREDASIPKQLSFHVYSGETQVKTMLAKRAPDSAQEGRK